ncbi:hypothetical protein LJR130_006306 [Variovorax sp. LjRoot130]|uniref:uracil-DNA glycosylase family protein n=1 Tax=Variovorax sp. LjRoot130 TaxID=3342261 RepID=UPI003ECFD5D6
MSNPKRHTHPAELLWAEQALAVDYPAGVLPVAKPIRGTAFFPGGHGLWNPNLGETMPEFPLGGTMILGHDFHSEFGYRDSLRRGSESELQPTWRNLLAVLAAAEIEPSDCFFTNVFMGLRAGAATTGTFPGARDPEFVAYCRRFLVRQLEVQRPSLIVTLGIHSPVMLAPLSHDLTSWGEGMGLKHLDRVGPVRPNVRISALPDFQTVVVALVHPSMRHACVRHRRYGEFAGAEAERRMLRDALSHARAANT